MANSILKWCKAKFFNGYKHISVEGSGDLCERGSETETLMRGSDDELFFTPRMQLPFSPSPGSHLDQPQKPMATYVEEVTCDVRVAAGSSEKQEFAFTLYDVDRQGKVTKDDIAGLVRTIYEAIGSSLSLPPYGSRTVRVKLTVAPETKVSQESSEACSSTPVKEPDSSRDEEEAFVTSTPKSENQDLPDTPKGPRRRSRRRSFQRQELLQIIQANMEKNNLFYPPWDNHHRHHHSYYGHKRHRSHCHKSTCTSHPDPACTKDKPLECQCTCVCCQSHSSRSTCHKSDSHQRSRSHDMSSSCSPLNRNNLMDNTCQPLPPSNTPDQTTHHHHHHHTHGNSRRRSSSYDANEGRESQKACLPVIPNTCNKKSKFRDGMTLHQVKHRYREADHARAMSRVMTWLENGALLRDDSSQLRSLPVDIGTTTKCPVDSPLSGCGHTHHVHQHFHHHYYHHTTAPPVLI